MEVKFSKPVSALTAENEGNYVIDGTSLAAGTDKAILQEDEKTVLITLGTAKAQDTKVQFTVKKVEGKESPDVVPDTLQEITFRDVTNPKVVSVTADGNAKLIVKFSEPVKTANNAANYRLNGQALSLFGFAGVIASTDAIVNDEFEIPFSTVLPVGTYKLTVSKAGAITDNANFPVAEAEHSVTVEASTSVPKVVSSTATKSVGGGNVSLVFDKKLDAKTVNSKTAHFKLNGTINASSVVLDGDGKTVQLVYTVLGGMTLGSNFIDVSENVKDTYGVRAAKVGEVQRVGINVVEDTTSPTVSGVTVASDKELRVKFNEGLEIASAQNAANYQVKNSLGNVVRAGSLSNLTAVLQSAPNDNQVYLTLTPALPGGTYTLEMSGVKDAAGNKMAPYTSSVMIPDTTPPSLAAKNPAVSTVLGGVATVKVTFNEMMKVSGEGSILDPNNYSYDTESKLPAGTKVEAGASDKEVLITFPSGITPSYITVMLVKDVSGNLIDGASQTVPVTAGSTLSEPKVDLNDGKTIDVSRDADADYITFYTDRPLKTVAKADFKVEVEGTDKTTEIVSAAVQGKKVTLTVNKGVLAAGNKVEVYTIGSPSSADEYGNKLTAVADPSGTINTNDEIAPALKEKAGSMADLKTTNTIHVYFDEDLDQSLGGTFKDQFVIDLNGRELLPKSTVVDNGNKDTVIITLHEDILGSDQKALKLYPKNTNSVQDLNGNAFVPTSVQMGTGVLIKDNFVPVAGTPNVAAYNPTTGVLTLTTAGATVGQRIDVSKVAFTSTGTPFGNSDSGSYTLTNSKGVVKSPTSIEILISNEDKVEVAKEDTLNKLGVTTQNGLVTDGEDGSADGAATIVAASTTVDGE